VCAPAATSVASVLGLAISLAIREGAALPPAGAPAPSAAAGAPASGTEGGEDAAADVRKPLLDDQARPVRLPCLQALG
jgi:hypothetical protein